MDPFYVLGLVFILFCEIFISFIKVTSVCINFINVCKCFCTYYEKNTKNRGNLSLKKIQKIEEIYHCYEISQQRDVLLKMF